MKSVYENGANDINEAIEVTTVVTTTEDVGMTGVEAGHTRHPVGVAMLAIIGDNQQNYGIEWRML